jgi:hypothetical protein
MTIIDIILIVTFVIGVVIYAIALSILLKLANDDYKLSNEGTQIKSKKHTEITNEKRN